MILHNLIHEVNIQVNNSASSLFRCFFLVICTCKRCEVPRCVHRAPALPQSPAPGCPCLGTPRPPTHQSFPSCSGQRFHQPKTLMLKDAQELNPQLLAGEFISFCARSCFYFHFSRGQGCCINQKKPDSAKFCPHLQVVCSSQVSSSLVALCAKYQGFQADNGGLTHGKIPRVSERVSVSLAGG